MTYNRTLDKTKYFSLLFIDNLEHHCPTFFAPECTLYIIDLLIYLQAAVAVNAADFKGLTPLMTACMFGRAATATFLLGMGALNHLTDINGDTALHWAAYKGANASS